MNLIKCVIRKIYYILRSIPIEIFKIFVAPYLKVDHNKIVFINFNGRGYGCNPKYIAAEMLNQGIGYDFVWLVSDIHEELPLQIRKRRYASISGLYELATAKIWVSNVRNFIRVNKKKEQFYIQTWHANLSMKKIEWDAENYLSKKYLKDIMYDSKITDLMLSNGKLTTECYRKTFRYYGEIIESGIPRNDIFKNVTDDVIKRVCNYLEIEEESKIILYVPTFRNNKGMEPYKFDYESVRLALSKKLNYDCIFVIRLHPNIAKDSSNILYTDKIKNASKYPDVQELIACSSVIISDYSSCLFDAILADKVPLVYANDIEEYMVNERDFYFSFEEMPFLVARNEKELLENINEVDFHTYNEKCKNYVSDIGLFETGNASKIVVERIESEMSR